MRRFVPFGITCLALIGCSKPAVARADKTYDNLGWISEAYMKATDELNRAPANREELNPYLQTRGNPDEILRSDNDNEDFVILWNVDYRVYQNERRPYPVIAYEKTGKKGTRYVLQGRVISQITNEQLKQVPFPDGQKAPF